MAKRELVESTAPPVGGEFGNRLTVVSEMVDEAQAVIRARSYVHTDEALFGAQYLADVAAEHILAASEAGCAIEQVCLLEDAIDRLLSAHAVLTMWVDRHEDPVLRAALRLLSGAQERAGSLYEEYSSMCATSAADELAHG